MQNEIIRYRLAPGVSYEHMLEVARDVHESWMSKQPGFLGWKIHAISDSDEYIDIVSWESAEHAKAAKDSMHETIAPDHEWSRCYDMSSVSCVKGEELCVL